MKAVEAVLLALYANGEAEAAGGGRMPVGRAATQRLVYLAGQRVEVEASHYAHYYGPHSDGVEEGLVRLWRHGCVREGATFSGHPVHSYSLTGDGERLGAEVAGGDGRGGYAGIRSVVRACRDFCGLRHGEMANAAKIHYMRGHNGRPRAGAAEIAEMGRRAGWVMGAGDIEEGLGLLGRLGLGGAARQ